MQELGYGERGGGSSPRVAALDAMMQGAGFTARASDPILQAMWEKWVFLATLGGITCLMRGTIGDIAAAPGGADLALQMLGECAAISTASGYQPSEAFSNRVAGNLTAAGSPLASSMYRDLQRGGPVEADQILGDLVARARQMGVATPLLAAAFAHLRVYAARI
jgi:2-dehydropantoate 2-reductase